MNFYRIFTIFIATLLLSGCIDEDYKLWGEGKSGHYDYKDIKRENAGEKLLIVIFTNPLRENQNNADKNIISGFNERYKSDEVNRKINFTNNPNDATKLTSRFIVQFDMAKNILPQELCATTTPLPFNLGEESTSIIMTVVYCNNEKAMAWVRAETLTSAKVDGELIEKMALKSLSQMTSPNFINENQK